jgi:CO/xanthine dehydrogenase FAD-binding subunit
VDLHTVRDVRPARLPVASWEPGDAWLAGGTHLFAEPRPALRRLWDLAPLGWEPLRVSDAGLTIAATCTVARLAAFAPPPGAGWTACRPLLAQVCAAFSSSFKIWHVATAGGNLCLALPAAPLVPLAVALSGSCHLLAPGGRERHLPAVEFVTGPGRTALAPGELLRALTLPAAALRARTAFRRASLHAHGRSATLVIGTQDPGDGTLTLTVGAALPRPLRLTLPATATAAETREALATAAGPRDWLDDPHGSPAWRRHLTLLFAEEIRRELTEGVPR